MPRGFALSLMALLVALPAAAAAGEPPVPGDDPEAGRGISAEVAAPGAGRAEERAGRRLSDEEPEGRPREREAAPLVAAAAGAGAESRLPNPIAQPDAPPQATREPPLGSLKEWIVAFRLIAFGKMTITALGDVEILVTPDGRRLWPVFRVLEGVHVGVEVLESGLSGPLALSFFPKDGRKVVLSVPDQTAAFGDDKRSVLLVARWSELRRAPEVYAPEEIMAEALGYRTEWDPAVLELRAHTQRAPDWFYAGRSKSPWLDLKNIQETPPNLPEVLPPSRPGANGLDFVEISLSSNYSAVRDLEDRGFALSRPRERLWGRALGGDFRLDLSQKGFETGARRSFASRSEDFLVDRAWWNVEGRRSALTLGDAELALGELIFPFAQLTGARWAGGAAAKPGELFAPVVAVEEAVAMESFVDLYVNESLVGSLRVRDPLKNRPGFGLARFEGIVLVPERNNRLRLVITEPSGIRTEVVREVWGSKRLLGAGQVAALAGVGTFRARTEWDSHGAFAGGVVRYGITPYLSAEILGGYQDGFLPRALRSRAAELAGLTVPEASSHVGLGLAVQPYRGGFAKLDLAGSAAREGGESDWAGRLAGDFRLGRLQVRPEAFRLGPDYFDGSSPLARDRLGFWAGATLAAAERLQISGGAGSIRNNLDGEAGRTLRETIERAEASIRGILPRTHLTLAADYIQQGWTGGQKLSLYSGAVNSTLLPRIELEGRVYAGDALYTAEHADLVGGLRLLELPFYASPYRGALLRWFPAADVSLSAAYWDYETRKDGLLGLQVAGKKWLRWDFQSELGKEWDDTGRPLRQTVFWNGRLAVYPDDSGNRRFSLQATYRSEQWSILATFDVLELFGFRGARPTLLTRDRVSPSMGCVMGTVFLDLDGDGRRQSDEPGVRKIGVEMGGESAESDGKGEFTLRANGSRKARVNLKLASLGGLYTPTNGTQVVTLQSGAISRVELGVAMLGSVTGTVQQTDPDGRTRPLSGAEVALYDGEGRKINRSVTAGDGSFYLGDVKPGAYTVKVEPATLPRGLRIRTPPCPIVMKSGKDEPVEIKVHFRAESDSREPSGPADRSRAVARAEATPEASTAEQVARLGRREPGFDVAER